VGFFMSFWY